MHKLSIDVADKVVEVSVYRASTKIKVDFATLSAAGLTKCFMYGLGRYLRDGCQPEVYEIDKKGNKQVKDGKPVLRAAATVSAEALALSEKKLAALVSGDIPSGGGGATLDPVARHFRANVIKWAVKKLSLKVKDVPKLGNTVADITTAADSLKGCPIDKLLAHAKVMAEAEAGLDI